VGTVRSRFVQLAGAAFLVLVASSVLVTERVAAQTSEDCPPATFTVVFRTDRTPPRGSRFGLKTPFALISQKADPHFTDGDKAIVGVDETATDGDTAGGCGLWTGKAAPRTMDNADLADDSTTLVCRVRDGWQVDTHTKYRGEATPALNELWLSSMKRRLVTARIDGSDSVLKFDSEACRVK
jgi:hypothetical protein